MNSQAYLNQEQVLHVAALAGQRLSEAGAETYRVEQTVASILGLSGAHGEAYALSTGLIASLDAPGLPPKTLVRRLRGRGINLYVIHVVNQISRDLVRGELTLEAAEEQLLQLDRTHYAPLLKDASTLLMSGAFALLLSGSFLDALASFINGITLVFVNRLATLSRMRPLPANVLAGFLTTFGARFVQSLILPGANYDYIIAGSLMLMFPGTAITNAIRDTLNGDYVSGAARAMEAFMTAASLAIGTGLGLWVIGGVFGW